MPLIDAAKILILAADGFDQSGLFRPRERLKDLGAEVRIASTGKAPIRGMDRDEPALSITPDMTLGEVDCTAFDALLIPDGAGSADHLRHQPRAIDIIRNFAESGKPVAALSCGTALLIEADLLDTEAAHAGTLFRDGNRLPNPDTQNALGFTDALIDLIEGR